VGRGGATPYTLNSGWRGGGRNRRSGNSCDFVCEGVVVDCACDLRIQRMHTNVSRRIYASTQRIWYTANLVCTANVHECVSLSIRPSVRPPS
jgi:hypothetical protein